MKLKYFLAIFTLLFLTSCEEKTIYTLIVETDIFVQEGKSTTHNISAGNGGYNIINPNPGIIKAEVNGSTIEYTGISEGKSIITLKDAENETVSIRVYVGIKPEEFTGNYSGDTSSDVLNEFGVSFEEATGTQNFTIKAKSDTKIRQLSGINEDYVILTEQMKNILKDESLTEIITFKQLPFTFGVKHNGEYSIVIIKDIQPTDNNMKKLSGFYFQAK